MYTKRRLVERWPSKRPGKRRRDLMESEEEEVKEVFKVILQLLFSIINDCSFFLPFMIDPFVYFLLIRILKVLVLSVLLKKKNQFSNSLLFVFCIRPLALFFSHLSVRSYTAQVALVKRFLPSQSISKDLKRRSIAF